MIVPAPSVLWVIAFRHFHTEGNQLFQKKSSLFILYSITFERISFTCFGSNLTTKIFWSWTLWWLILPPSPYCMNLTSWVASGNSKIPSVGQPGYDRGNYIRTKVFPIVFNKSSTIWKVSQTGSNTFFTFIGWWWYDSCRKPNHIITQSRIADDTK